MRVYVHDAAGKRVDELAEGTPLAEVVLGADPGVEAWAENAEEPLDRGLTVAEIANDGYAVIHVGNGKVDVEVQYNGQTRSKAFGPGVKVDKVFNWAVSSEAFDLSETDAHDLILRLHGNPSDLDPDTHVGTIANGDRELCLDLVPVERFAG